MTDERKQKQIVDFNNFINTRIKRLQKLPELLSRAIDRNVIIYDSQAPNGELSIRLFENVIDVNKNIAYAYSKKDLDLFYAIQDYLFYGLDCCQVVGNGKTNPILFVNNEDEPILGMF